MPRRSVCLSVRPSVCLFRFLIISVRWMSICARPPFQTHSKGGQHGGLCCPHPNPISGGEYSFAERFFVWITVWGAPLLSQRRADSVWRRSSWPASATMCKSAPLSSYMRISDAFVRRLDHIYIRSIRRPPDSASKHPTDPTPPPRQFRPPPFRSNRVGGRVLTNETA